MNHSTVIRGTRSLLTFLSTYPRAKQTYRDIPPLPKTVKNRLGEIVDLSGDAWRAAANRDGRGVATYPIGLLRRPRDYSNSHDSKASARPRRTPVIDDRLILALLRYVVDYMRVAAPLSSANLVVGFIHLERFLHEHYRWRVPGRRRRFSISDLNAEMFAAYGHHIEQNCPSNGRYGSFLRGFYLWGVDNRLPDFNVSELRRIAQIQFSYSKTKGRVARFRDPKKGALVWEEEQQVVRALEQGLGDPHDRAIAAVFYETGIRAEAGGRVRESSLAATPNPDIWKIEIPRIKKRRITNETYDRNISSHTAQLLRSLHSAGSNGFLFHWIGSEQTTNELRDAVASWAKEAQLKTNRLNCGRTSPLPLTPSRFRRTLATNMADRGATPEEIAVALDDESLAMAAVYASTSSNIVDVLAATLDRHPAWYRLLDLFAGRVEADDDHSFPEVLGGVPYLAGYADAVKWAGIIGRCTYTLICRLRPPLSCYRCPYFVASRKIERHEAQLEQLKTEIDASIGMESDRMADVLTPAMAAILSLIAKIRLESGIANDSVASRVAGKIASRVTRR